MARITIGNSCKVKPDWTESVGKLRKSFIQLGAGDNIENSAKIPDRTFCIIFYLHSWPRFLTAIQNVIQWQLQKDFTLKTIFNPFLHIRLYADLCLSFFKIKIFERLNLKCSLWGANVPILILFFKSLQIFSYLFANLIFIFI